MFTPSALASVPTMDTFSSDSLLGARYDEDTGTFHAKFVTDNRPSLAGAVVYLVSVAIGQEPEAMDPLFEAVDPDALDVIFRSRESRTNRVEFRYCGCDVTVISDGEVRVTPPDPAR